MNANERRLIRLAIDAARRRRLTACESGWENPETGYRHGCRCDACRLGTAAARKARQQRRAARA